MKKRFFCTLSLALVCMANTSVLAQGMMRVFPEKAELGYLLPVAYPEVVLNGKPDRLSAGSLVRDLNNRIVLLNTLPSAEVIVSYTREPTTNQIQFVWILNQPEFEREKERIKQKRRAERDAAAQ